MLFLYIASTQANKLYRMAWQFARDLIKLSKISRSLWKIFEISHKIWENIDDPRNICEISPKIYEISPKICEKLH